MWKAALVLCLVASACAFEDKTIFQYLQDNGYTTLASLLTSQGLATALAGPGPMTLFAPTEAAFAKLGTTTLNSLSNGQLSAILRYHVVGEFVLIPMVTGPQSKITLEGQEINIMPDRGSLTLNNLTHVDASNNDIIVNNGVIQPVDSVIIPPELASDTITQVLLRDDTRFKDLFMALLLAGLTGALEQNEYTLFAPTDAAFEVYQDNLLSPETPNAQAIYQEVLKYHVVPGSRRANQLTDGQSLFTLHGTALNVTVDSRGVGINTAMVIDADIAATNGVIHAIDRVLIPQDINQVANQGGRR